MSRILIVDDDPAYRDQLTAMLGPEGYEIRTAASGREAIDVGGRFRPDVLLVDWMLKDRIHGLHVAEVLRLVDSRIRAILMTDYASPDLSDDAAKLRVLDLIEKPLEAGRVRVAVRRALLAEAPPSSEVPIAVIEVDPAGRILYANERASKLFAETNLGAAVTTFADLFPPETVPDLDRAAERWVAASPRSPQPIRWHLRSQAPRATGSRLVAILRPEDPHSLGIQLIEMLLEFKEPGRAALWPFEERVLVIDGDPTYRRILVRMLDTAGAGCYGAASADDAVRLLRDDEDIGFVILDYDLPGAEPAELVRSLRSIRPEVAIVGSSEEDRSEAFATIGVSFCLVKPWRVQDLVHRLL